MSQHKPLKPDVPTSDEFLRIMGQVCWLLSLSKDHREKPISLIEAHVSAPLMLKQVRVITRGNQPIAALTWAYVSPEIKALIETGDHIMDLKDWRSGPEVMVIDVISPLMDGKIFIDRFLGEVAELKK